MYRYRLRNLNLPLRYLNFEAVRSRSEIQISLTRYFHRNKYPNVVDKALSLSLSLSLFRRSFLERKKIAAL